MEHTKWAYNHAGINKDIFNLNDGSANEFLAIGRTIKAGFPCFKTGIKGLKYDAVIQVVKTNKFLRAQIIGASTGKISLGKYTKQDCDLVLAFDGTQGDCYLIPIDDLGDLPGSTSFEKLSNYKENWDLLLEL